MNPTIKLLKNHRTYRHFDTEYKIPQNELDDIIASAQQAPSWMNGQHYSIIHIKNNELRQQIAVLQDYNPQVKTASVLLLFIADLHKASIASQRHQKDFQRTPNIESLITAATDASLAAENAMIAAESLGYGTCFVGGARSIAATLIELLKLPNDTYPLYFLCIGKPVVKMNIKPRLPREAVYFEDAYSFDLEESLQNYEAQLEIFAEERETLAWGDKLARYHGQEPNPQNRVLWYKQNLLSRNK